MKSNKIHRKDEKALAAIKFQCQIFFYFGFRHLSPEAFRLAKFNNSIVIDKFRRSLHDIVWLRLVLLEPYYLKVQYAKQNALREPDFYRPNDINTRLDQAWNASESALGTATLQNDDTRLTFINHFLCLWHCPLIASCSTAKQVVMRQKKADDHQDTDDQDNYDDDTSRFAAYASRLYVADAGSRHLLLIFAWLLSQPCCNLVGLYMRSLLTDLRTWPLVSCLPENVDVINISQLAAPIVMTDSSIHATMSIEKIVHALHYTLGQLEMGYKSYCRQRKNQAILLFKLQNLQQRHATMLLNQEDTSQSQQASQSLKTSKGVLSPFHLMLLKTPKLYAEHQQQLIQWLNDAKICINKNMSCEEQDVVWWQWLNSVTELHAQDVEKTQELMNANTSDEMDEESSVMTNYKFRALKIHDKNKKTRLQVETGCDLDVLPSTSTSTSAQQHLKGNALHSNSASQLWAQLYEMRIDKEIIDSDDNNIDNIGVGGDASLLKARMSFPVGIYSAQHTINHTNGEMTTGISKPIYDRLETLRNGNKQTLEMVVNRRLRWSYTRRTNTYLNNFTCACKTEI